MDNELQQNATANANSWEDAENLPTPEVTEDKPKTRGEGQKEKPVRDRHAFSLLSEAVSTTSFRANDANTVRSGMNNLLATISAMSMREETEIGIKVDGVLYRFGEYRATHKLANLVAPAKVVVTDVITATDFLKRDSYAFNGGKVLDPATFELTLRNVCSKLRVNPTLVPIQRDSCMLLSEATKYAVNRRKVVDSNQDRIIFLTQAFDDEADYNIELWAKQFASKGID